MPQFRYKALSPAGEALDGLMEAANADEVIAKLQDAGNIPLKALPADQANGAGLAALFQRSPMGPTQVLQFTQQLSTLLGAGQPLDRALQILLDLPESEQARRVIDRIRESVRGGTPLSQAMEAQSGVFSRLYVNMVRAGEIGGALDDTLKRLADYLERSKALKESVINAMIYPTILVVLVLGAIGLLVGYVVPQFLPLFEDMGAEIPWLTAAIMSVGLFVQGWWWLLLVGAVATVWLAANALADPARRLQFDAWVLGRGLLGQLLAKLDTARLARTLATRNVLTNTALSEAVGQAAEEVKTGGGLATALGRSKLFPRLALQMISVGEESGAMDAMLSKVADTFDSDVRNTIDRLLSALVPAITIVMAFAVAIIMMAILIPIFELTNTVG
jgi:general secretion pathway protein F